jgi:hypothetical protein
MKYQASLQRIGNIAGMHYVHERVSDTLIIYGIGAPIPPDNGTLPDAKILMRYDTDIFVPDYIGYGRSDGRFTPLNCIKTFLLLYDAFTNGCITKNAYTNVKTRLSYKRVIIIGRSLGGTYVPLLPRFNKTITELALFCPVVDSKSCGSIPGEESNVDFLRSMRKDGYYHLYRGIVSPVWEKHLENEDDLSPMDNMHFLANAKVFIAHGEKDTCVNYSKSVRYHDELLRLFPKKSKDFLLKIYPDGDHGSSTTNQASENLMRWLGLLKLAPGD